MIAARRLIVTATRRTNLEVLAASSAVSACGEERSGAVRKSRVKRASKKQEDSGLAEVA
jgi:hypothetical protein